MEKITRLNYVDQAENAITRLAALTDKKGKKKQMVTTSKIRNLLAMSSDIYNQIIQDNEEDLKEEIVSRIEYLRVRFIYEAGREPSVNDFLKETRVLDVLKDINGSRENYILFNRYMEALVAFHKYYGGKEQ